MSKDNQNTVCKCGEAFPVHGPDYIGGSGYAVLPSGERICYVCADAAQREDLKDRSKPFMGYVAFIGGQLRITTWTGGKLMDVTKAKPCELTRQSYTHNRKGYMSIHAVDVHGGHWTGRGSEGIAIKLRAVKA